MTEKIRRFAHQEAAAEILLRIVENTDKRKKEFCSMVAAEIDIVRQKSGIDNAGIVSLIKRFFEPGKHPQAAEAAAAIIDVFTNIDEKLAIQLAEERREQEEKKRRQQMPVGTP